MHQSALLELLEVVKSADVSDRIRKAAEAIYQALIDAESTAVIGAGPWEPPEGLVAQRNGSRPRTLTTRPGIWSCGSLSCGRAGSRHSGDVPDEVDRNG